MKKAALTGRLMTVLMMLFAVGFLTPAIATTLVCSSAPLSVNAILSYPCGPTITNGLLSIGSTVGSDGDMFIVLGEYDDVEDRVSIMLNPTLTTPPSPAGLWFRFTVNGVGGRLIEGVGLEVGGSGASVDEIICATPITLGGNCTGGPVNELAHLTRASGQSLITGFFDPIATINGFKDVITNQHLTIMRQDFYLHPTIVGPTNPIPEPATCVLVGFALLGVGLYRQRQRSS